MTRPITDVLIEFSRRNPPLIPAGLFAVPDDPEADAADPEAAARALTEARQAGFAEGRAQAEAVAADRLAALAAGQEAALADARAQWAATEGHVLAQALADDVAALERSIAQAFAEAVTPLLADAARTRAVDAVQAALADLLAGGQGELIAVSGPADLVEPLRRAFADNPAITIAEAEDGEVSVRAGATTIVTQIAAWTSRLQAAVGHPHE